MSTLHIAWFFLACERVHLFSFFLISPFLSAYWGIYRVGFAFCFAFFLLRQYLSSHKCINTNQKTHDAFWL